MLIDISLSSENETVQNFQTCRWPTCKSRDTLISLEYKLDNVIIKPNYLLDLFPGACTKCLCFMTWCWFRSMQNMACKYCRNSTLPPTQSDTVGSMHPRRWKISSQWECASHLCNDFSKYFPNSDTLILATYSIYCNFYSFHLKSNSYKSKSTFLETFCIEKLHHNYWQSLQKSMLWGWLTKLILFQMWRWGISTTISHPQSLQLLNSWVLSKLCSSEVLIISSRFICFTNLPALYPLTATKPTYMCHIIIPVLGAHSDKNLYYSHIVWDSWL